MKCQSCKHENRAQAKFCEQCGTTLELKCASCGAGLRAEAKFCDSCGHAVSAEIDSTPDSPTIATTPRHIADAIRRDHSAMEGERRIVTVLFADAVGHTSISEQLDPEEVYGLMQGCFERMQAAVHKYEGTVNQFTGDGILALFGAPIAHEDSARRGISAALEMQKTLAVYAAEMQARYPIECSYRVGLNTGPVVVGRISDDLDLEFAAIGDTVNLASRMESMAESGTVQLSENTYRAAKHYFEFEPVGELEVKGKARPVPSYRALRDIHVRKRLDAAAQQGLTKYVGRVRELSILSNYLNEASTNEGRIVLLTGEAGMGKSRLLLEFRSSMIGPDVKCLEGHCVAYGRMTPYLPFIDIIKRNFAIQEGDDEEVIINKIEAGTENWESAHESASAYLRFLLNVDPGDESVVGMDPIERRAGILDALRALLLEECRDKTLLVIVEDLHWIDEKAEEAISVLYDAMVTLPILLVLTARPGYQHRLSERSYFARVVLNHLPTEDSTAIVEGVLESASLPAKLINMIAEKAEGNPFYIEEVTKSLVEEGVLKLTDGSYRFDSSFEDVNVPDTIHEVILARIDRLDRNARGAMQLASVIGREFTARLLNRIADVGAELDDLLIELKSLELIYETGYAPELSYMFKHALTHDVAYSTLLIERRRSLHRIVAIAIEELYEDRLPEHYEALAFHYRKGHLWDKALDYLEKAGDKAVQAYANQDAIRFYEQALDACTSIGESALGKVAEIAEKRGWVNFVVADYDSAVHDAARLIAAADAMGKEKSRGRALSLKGLWETYAHEYEEAEASFLEAIKIGEETNSKTVSYLGHVGMYGALKTNNRHEEADVHFAKFEALPLPSAEAFAQSYSTFFIALDHNWKGNFRAAAEHAKTWRSLPASTPEVMLLHVRWSEALIEAGMGEYPRSILALHEIANDCARMGEVAVQARAFNTLGWIYGELQDHAKAIEYSDRGVEVALLEGDEPEKISNAQLNWADNLVALGRYDEAEKFYKGVEQVVRNPRPKDRWMLWRFSQHYFHSYGKLCVQRNETEKALKLAEECLSLALPSESRKYIVKARRLKAEALKQAGEFTPATKELQLAVNVAVESGNPPQIWKSYASLGQLFAAQGKKTEALQAYRLGVEVISSVEKGLVEESLRGTFLASDEVKHIMTGAE